VNVADIRFLFAYDRWATSRILDALERDGAVDEVTWSAKNAIDRRGLGGILVHALGAHQRWRHGLSGSDVTPRPERRALPQSTSLRRSWEREWVATATWLSTIDDAWLAKTDEGVPYWQMLLHLVNHGTRHRVEVAALLTGAGRSPGDIDMIDFAEERAKATQSQAKAG
jgi:uncharacterized damage-inducible protein DinB